MKNKDIVNVGEIEKKKRKMNKKKMIITISIAVILLVIGITMIVYYSSRDARKFLDQYLFRKNVTQEALNSIELDYNSNVSVFAYNRYICVLAENKLMQYNTSGNLEHELDLEINNPVYSVNNKYIAISEQNGTKLNLISGSEILWTKNVDGTIYQISVNNNGYVNVVLTGTTHKSVIVTFDNEGNELFRTYRSTTTVIDTSISNNNEYLAFAEVNTSGTAIQSNVTIISIAKADEAPADAIVYTYSAEGNKLTTNIVYNGNDKVICMYDSEITTIQNQNNSIITNLSENGKNINFANINLENCIYRAIEENEGLFNTNTVLEIQNVNNGNTSVYTVEGAAKYIYSSNNIIAVSLGQDIEFVNTSGWLLKSYHSTQEAQNVTIGNGMAGIVYNDRVEIINL